MAASGATMFQSLLYWIGRGDYLTSTVAVICLMFQSLLYWIGRGDYSGLAALACSARVSILVVLDWAWGPCSTAGCSSPSNRVSILVVLDWAWGQNAATITRPRMNTVSILVVLDWAWGHTNHATRQRKTSGFNPCCIGLGVGTTISMEFEVATQYRFNPCCIGLGVGTHAVPCLADGRAFVSILVVLDWAWGPIPYPRRTLSTRRFNPCCIGLGVGTPTRYERIQCAAYGFQSLLYWIGRGDLCSWYCCKTSSLGFNPCCIGLGVGTSRYV